MSNNSSKRILNIMWSTSAAWRLQFILHLAHLPVTLFLASSIKSRTATIMWRTNISISLQEVDYVSCIFIKCFWPLFIHRNIETFHKLFFFQKSIEYESFPLHGIYCSLRKVQNVGYNVGAEAVQFSVELTTAVIPALRRPHVEKALRQTLQDGGVASS